MKNLIFLLFFSATMYSQNIDMPQYEVSKLLCRKWKISFGEKKHEVEHKYPRLKDYHIEFFPDGTLKLDRNGKKFSGQWCYDNEKHHVEFKTFEDWLVISHLNTSELIVIMKKDRPTLKKGERPQDYSSFVPVR